MSQEDFDIQSLATYLHLTPTQVEKMASRGKLPGRRVAGEWRFSAAEIHHWFERRIGLSDEQELVQVEKELDSYPSESLTRDVRIQDLMTPSAISIPLLAKTRHAVIESLCQQAAQLGLLWDSDRMVELIRAREELYPTALENGVALLHPRRPQPELLAEPFVTLGITTSGIPFGGPRGSLTDVFFLVASTDDPGHLRVLTRLSRLISTQYFLEQLRVAQNGKQAMQIIAETDAAFDS